MAPAHIRARGHIAVCENRIRAIRRPGASRTEYAFFKYHLVRALENAEKGIHYPASQLRSACAASHNQPGPALPDRQRPELRARERG